MVIPMINTKYNIGDKVSLSYKVKSIQVTRKATTYTLERKLTDGIWKDQDVTIMLAEEEIDDTDTIPTETYEAEINDLKDEINRLREMYQLEHEKALKLKSVASTAMPSHNPNPNIYGGKENG